MTLDTNALSALAARDKDLIELLAAAPRLSVTLISLGEYEYGISRSSKKSELRKWLDALLERVSVLSPTLATLPYYAEIRNELQNAGTPIPANDVWIAALARQYAVPVVSRDTHLDKVAGLERLDW